MSIAMYNKIKNSLISPSLFFLAAWACEPPPELSIIPNISYEKLEYIASDITSDSLILYLNFEDGDGDVGLEGTENEYPYHPFNFILDSEGKRVTIGGNSYTPPFYSVPLDYSFRPIAEGVLFSEADNRPSFSCRDYEIIEYFVGQNQTETDTFYIQKNPNHRNIYIEFYRKVGNNYEFIDWNTVFGSGCNLDFNARFPIFDKDNMGRSLSGTLRYAMVSSGFEIILKKDTFKIKTYIKDRALHDSNYAESPDLTLDMIKVN